MLAKDIMTKDVACCTPDTSLRAAAQLMRDQDCGCLPVKAGEHESSLVGMVTDRDIACRAVAEGMDPQVITVSTIMSSPVATISCEATEAACCDKLANQQIRRLVVVDEHGNTCGIIAQGDVARRSPPDKTGDLVKEISQPDKGQQPKQLTATGAAGIPFNTKTRYRDH